MRTLDDHRLLMVRLAHPLFPAAIGVAVLLAGCGEKAVPLALTADPPIVVVWAGPEHAQGTATGDIYVVSADGATPKLVRRWPSDFGDGQSYGAFNALWSRERDAVAISLGVWVGDPGARVAVVSLGGKMRTLTGGYDRQLVSLSTDGTELIHRTFYSGGRDVWSVPMGGGPSRLLPFVTPNDSLREFDWSPDGRRVIAQLYEGGLVTMNARGKNVARITRGDDSDPSWSPDGRTVLYTHSTYNNETQEYASNVYVVNADGSDPRALTDDDDSSALGWSPDGNKVLFRRGAIDEAKPNRSWNELWAMNAEGGQQTRLPFNRPGWSVLAADWGRS